MRVLVFILPLLTSCVTLRPECAIRPANVLAAVSSLRAGGFLGLLDGIMTAIGPELACVDWAAP